MDALQAQQQMELVAAIHQLALEVHHKGDGKGKGLHGDYKGKVQGPRLTGSAHCGQGGHAPANCSTLHTEQMPWNKTSHFEEDNVAVGGI